MDFAVNVEVVSRSVARRLLLKNPSLLGLARYMVAG